MASKLAIYNAALAELGERKITSLSENREPRRVLDSCWDAEFTDQVLSMAQWNFAMRTAQMDYSASIEPDFGFQRAFDKPSDWVRTSAVCSDEYFKVPLLDYSDEAGYWYADLDTIYVKFVSNGSSYGGDLSLWPANVGRYAAVLLASQACERITNSTEKQSQLEAKAERLLTKARSTDAMDEATAFPAQGSWASARFGRTQRDRGSRNRLIG